MFDLPAGHIAQFPDLSRRYTVTSFEKDRGTYPDEDLYKVFKNHNDAIGQLKVTPASYYDYLYMKHPSKSIKPLNLNYLKDDTLRLGHLANGRTGNRKLQL